MLRNTIPTDALLLTEILLRWPRLPVETSLPLDFGATPINESKVGNSYDFVKCLRNVCLQPKEKKHLFLGDGGFFVLDKDVHVEESVLISGRCRDSNPLPVLCPSGGPGSPDKMVCKCL